MIMQVHDELVFEVRSEKVAFYSELIKTQMESAADFSSATDCRSGSRYKTGMRLTKFI